MKKILRTLYWALIRSIPPLAPVWRTRETQTPVPLKAMLLYLLRVNRHVYWPTHPSSTVVDPARIHIGIETSPGLMPGCYVQGTNGIEIGDYTQIAAGVAMISANHELHDNRRHVATGPIRIGSHSWLGAHCVILPGVRLGTYTVVGAGAIVTKSFEEGYQVLAGNPARVIKKLDPERCVLHRSREEFHGFIAAQRFEAFRARRLRRVA